MNTTTLPPTPPTGLSAVGRLVVWDRGQTVIRLEGEHDIANLVELTRLYEVAGLGPTPRRTA